MAVLAAAVWRVRPSGSNTNGGGYDGTNYPGGTDYSQQNSAQASGTNATTSGAGSTTFTDATAAAFTSSMVGNCIQITAGTNFQTGFYFVVTFTNANSVVLDRTPSSGGAGSAGVWKLGGGWADFWTNTPSTGPVVANNTVFILGSGTPNPAAYTYDYTTTVAFGPAGNNVVYANDPSTPGYKAFPDTTGGMPVVKWNHTGNVFNNASGNDFVCKGLWFVGTANSVTGVNLFNNTATNTLFYVLGCIYDQFSFDTRFAIANNGPVALYGCEVFTSVAPGANGTKEAILSNIAAVWVVGCNIHDTVGPGITTVGAGLTITNTIIAKCRATGITMQTTAAPVFMRNCTIDGNIGSGVNITAAGQTSSVGMVSNIFSNHTQAGTYGINNSAGGIGQLLIDFNVFYNNTTDLNNLSYGPHDTHGGANPYVGQATENYALA
jgi:hypothetical protein